MAVRADDVDLNRDRSLVELCQAGNQEAFGDLYARYYQRLLRFCMRRVGNAHEAEEITQEAFARAFHAMPRFAGERRFYPWLTVIAARLCIDSHRRSARSEPSADVEMGSVEGGEEQIIAKVDLAYLAQALENLGPRHREVLELRETQGWSYQQIADHFNVTLGTVEALLFRARKALRREFLALVGEDGRLIALPGLGLLLRGAANLRSRLHDLSSQVTPLAAAGAMSVAAVAGVALSAPSHPTIKPVAPVTKRVAQPTTPIVETRDAVRDTVGAATSGVSTPAKAAPAEAVGLASGSAADGRARTQDDNASLKLAGITLSSDATDLDPLLSPMHRGFVPASGLLGKR